MKKATTCLLLFCCLWAPQAAAEESRKVLQFSAIRALLEGVFEGAWTVDQLKERGDFGIGTFDGLDGELIARGGNFYRADADGKIAVTAGSRKVPYATLTRFSSPEVFTLPPGAGYDEACRAMDALLPTRNIFYALEIEGEFEALAIRSVPAQKPPYRRMREFIPEEQKVIRRDKIRGVMVGFRMPPYTAGLNVPGYHFHFLSENRDVGGHVLGFKLVTAPSGSRRCMSSKSFCLTALNFT
ncbi:MAG: acetolactate decarboxylase [Candidatus Omnitrophota bacterium]|jgi:acetolactate decarboxylase